MDFPSSERFSERRADFEKALSRLEEALREPETPLIRDATIQRFEFTYELAWKTMKLWLAEKGILVRNPKDTLQAALEQGLISDGAAWSHLHAARNLTSHTYEEENAIQIYETLKDSGLALFLALQKNLKISP